MKKYPLIFSLLFSIAITQAQENPKIDKKTFFISPEGIENAKKAFEAAEKYYKKGFVFYNEALKNYLNVYQYNPASKELNYKIGACYLWTSARKSSLPYLLNSTPEVAKDYYLLLGRSYQYNLKFAEAKEAYKSHMESLSKWKRLDSRKQYKQLIDECTASETLLKVDSAAVLIVNLGPVINSNYDDYGAWLFEQDSSIYLTSKRPKRESAKKVSGIGSKERILVSNNCINQPSTYAMPVPKISSSKNISIAGVDRNKTGIYFYKGKRKTGQLMKAGYKGKTWKTNALKGRINHIAYKETSISIASDSTAYYVTNRRGGEGGKDIWVCRQKKDNKFSKPYNLGKTINTSFDEEGVYVTPDGKTLYFSSKGRKGMGGFDVYKSEKQADGKWSEPKNLGHPINSPADELFYHPTSDPNVALISTIRDDSLGGLDIYKIQTGPGINKTIPTKEKPQTEE
ncbi:MAG: flagellar motor protein [Prolixibacteraceae bacterium]|nr:MAG: flagellar motor protein [Prolixibacteraceae bacterium]